jgi:hypothetical protein
MLLLFLSSLSSANDFTVDRPTVATSGATIGKGILQLETGLQIDIPSPTFTIPTLVRLGVTPTTELRLFSNVVTVSNKNGYGPLGLEAKQTVFKSENMIVGVLTNGVISFDDSPLSVSAIGLLDYNSGSWSSWLNLGISGSNPSNFEIATLFAIGSGVTITDSIQVCLEQSGTITDTFTGYSQISVLHSSNNIQWDVYYQGSTHDLSEHIIGVGYSRQWSLY